MLHYQGLFKEWFHLCSCLLSSFHPFPGNHCDRLSDSTEASPHKDPLIYSETTKILRLCVKRKPILLPTTAMGGSLWFLIPCLFGNQGAQEYGQFSSQVSALLNHVACTQPSLPFEGVLAIPIPRTENSCHLHEQWKHQQTHKHNPNARVS